MWLALASSYWDFSHQVPSRLGSIELDQGGPRHRCDDMPLAHCESSSHGTVVNNGTVVNSIRGPEYRLAVVAPDVLLRRCLSALASISTWQWKHGNRSQNIVFSL